MLALSRDTLRRALDRGETCDSILAFLNEYSQTRVPQNVEYLIREVGGKHGHIRIGQAGLYMVVNDPMLLLMDEPFGALDAMTRDQLGIDLLRIWEANRITVVFVTHSIPEAVLLADRVVVMTPRPGEIADVLTVEIERPRTLERVNTPAFGEYVSHIRRLLEHEDSFH